MKFGPHEYDCDNYTEEEREEARTQSVDVLNLWNAFSEQLFSTSAYQGVHPPIALMDHYASILEGSCPLDPLCGIVQCTEEAVSALNDALLGMTVYGDVMFQFGQYCAARGLLSANLVPCKCAAVTDEALQRLLEEGR